jgi:hypothetical protein
VERCTHVTEGVKKTIGKPLREASQGHVEEMNSQGSAPVELDVELAASARQRGDGSEGAVGVSGMVQNARGVHEIETLTSKGWPQNIPLNVVDVSACQGGIVADSIVGLFDALAQVHAHDLEPVLGRTSGEFAVPTARIEEAPAQEGLGLLLERLKEFLLA